MEITLKHGDFEVKLLPCTSAAYDLFDYMENEGMSSENLKGIKFLFNSLWFAHKAWCEDNGKALVCKKSEFFEKIFLTETDNTNIEDVSNKLLESIKLVNEKTQKKMKAIQKPE